LNLNISSMKKLSKRAEKRFLTIPWDTKEYLGYTINLEFPTCKYIIGEDTIITDFYLSNSDKYPFCSIYGKKINDTFNNFLIGFGTGKKMIFKKLRQGNFECTMMNVRDSFRAFEIGLQLPIQQKVILNCE